MDPISILQAIPGVGAILPYFFVSAGVAASIMPWLPKPASTSSLYGMAYTALNMLGQNYGNAANANTTAVPKS